MDISNLTYKELEILEKEINEKKKENARGEYKGLVRGVVQLITAIINQGYGSIIAYYNDKGEPYDWGDLRVQLRDGYAKKEMRD